MNFDSFMNEWLGRRIDYDKVYAYQCVDLILQYIYECYGIPSGVNGNAIDYWNNPSIPLLDKFDKLDGSDALQGDIVVLNGLPGNADGHIGIATGNVNASDVEILEQNGADGNGSGVGGDAIRTRYLPRSRVAGLLRPKDVVAAPVVHPYTIEQIPTKQVKLNKDTHLWGLNYDNFTAINANPQADAIAGTLITVNAILHHNIGYDYYLPDSNVASGYNVLDCDDYTPPPPAGQLPFPSSETYDVVTELPGYTTSNSAINHIGPNATVPAGNYSVFNTRVDSADPSKLLAVNVTKTNGMAGAWINVADNVETPPEPPAPPEPEAVVEPATPAVPNQPAFAGTYKQWPQAEIYVAMANVPVVDLAGTKTVTMPQYSVTKIAGTFVVNGVEYARPLSAVQKDMWYGIRFTDPQTGLPDIELESVIYSSKTTIAERQVTHTLKTEDKLALVASHLRNAYLSFVSLLGRIKPDVKNKK